MPPSNHALRARRVRLACCNLGKPRRIWPQQGGVRQRLGTSPRSRARACLFEPPQATSHRLRGLFSRRVLCRRLHPVRVPEPALPARPDRHLRRGRGARVGLVRHPHGFLHQDRGRDVGLQARPRLRECSAFLAVDGPTGSAWTCSRACTTGATASRTRLRTAGRWSREDPSSSGTETSATTSAARPSRRHGFPRRYGLRQRLAKGRDPPRVCLQWAPTFLRNAHRAASASCACRR